MGKHRRCSWTTSRDQRRQRAEELTIERSKRSPKQQLALIATRPGESARETKRLLEGIARRKVAVPKKKGPSGRKKKAPKKAPKGGAK